MARHRSRFALALAALLTAGCSTTTDTHIEQTPTTPPDPELPYTNHWSAEPGIDIFDRGPELVRASLEAGQYAAFFSVHRSFPGYRDAIGYPDKYSLQTVTDIVVSGRPGSGRISPLTYHYHIADITETSDTITAEVCAERVTVETRTSERGERHGFSWMVSLTNTDDTPGLPGIADTDPDRSDPRARRVPDWNVFGTWNITQLRTGGRDASTATAHPACTDWWLGRHPGSDVRNNYTFAPAGEIPGQPRLPQYPEWIGPSHPE